MKLTTKIKMNKVLNIADTAYQQKGPNTICQYTLKVLGIVNVCEGGHSPPFSPLFIETKIRKKRVE